MYVPKQQDRIEECYHRFCSCEVSSVQVNTDGFQYFEKREEIKIYACVCRPRRWDQGRSSLCDCLPLELPYGLRSQP